MSARTARAVAIVGPCGPAYAASMVRTHKKATSRPIVSDKRWQRLQPFLKRKEARQRLMLYLLAANATVGELVRMTRNQLRGLPLHAEMTTCRDELFDLFPVGTLAFVFTSGNGMKHTNVYRMLRMATTTETGRPMSQEQFRTHLDSK